MHGSSANQVLSMRCLAAQCTHLFAAATHQQAFEYSITLLTHSQAWYRLKLGLHAVFVGSGETLFLSRSCLAWVIKLAVRQGMC